MFLFESNLIYLRCKSSIVKPETSCGVVHLVSLDWDGLFSSCSSFCCRDVVERNGISSRGMMVMVKGCVVNGVG